MGGVVRKVFLKPGRYEAMRIIACGAYVPRKSTFPRSRRLHAFSPRKKETLDIVVGVVRLRAIRTHSRAYFKVKRRNLYIFLLRNRFLGHVETNAHLFVPFFSLLAHVEMRLLLPNTVRVGKNVNFVV